MKTYTVTAGDTFERISTIEYGVPTEVGLLISANPHASGGLVPGMVLTIPTGPTSLTSSVKNVTAGRENDVSVSLGGKPFRFWSGLSIERSIDRFDKFSLTAPFEPDNAEFRAAFVPMSFQLAELFVGGELLYTGTGVDIRAGASIAGRVVTAEGYALAGVLNDCPLPGSSFPIEYSFLTLKDIALEQAKPFGLTPEFTAPPGAAFDRVAMQADTKVLTFWRKLAKQKNLVIGNTTTGQPVFQQETDAPPIQLLEFGVSPVLRITPELNPQQYYSHVTAVTPAFIGVDGTQHTIENPFLRGVIRPLTFNVGDVLPGDEVDLANAKMGRMFANSIAYRVDVAGWRDVNGDLWSPNTQLRLLAPQVMIYQETKFLVRSVTLSRDAQQDVASLLCVLPGAFSGKIPERLPWTE